MQSLKQNITQMKKTIYLLLLASLAIAGCVATREIPLTVNPEIYATAEQLDSLPVLPSDLSQIKYIHLPDSLTGEGEWPVHYLSRDYMENYEMIQLEGIPGMNEYDIFDIQSDDNLLFVTYNGTRNDSTKLRLPRIHAIYTRQGKLVSQIGKGIATIEEKNGEGKTVKETPEEEKHSDIQYYLDSRLGLNRQRKEVYFNELGGKQVYFDYKGNYKRTEYTQTISYTTLTTRDTKVGMYIDFSVAYWNKLHGILIGKNGAPQAVAFKRDPLHRSPLYGNVEAIHQIDDDLMLGFSTSDTIWQILPDRKVARYVCTGALAVPEQARDYNIALSKRWGNHIRKEFVLASGKYVLLNLRRVGAMPHNLLFDAETGHSIWWTIDIPFTNTIIGIYIDLAPQFTLLPDGTLISFRDLPTPYELKKLLSQELNPESTFGKHIDSREEKFIRNLKLDGGPVLFFVKLKKF